MVRTSVSALILIACCALSSYATDKTATLAYRAEPPSREPASTPLPPRVTEAYEYYTVNGCCESDLHCDLRKKGIRCSDGKVYDAQTRWQLKWDYSHLRGPDSCKANAFQVSLHITYRFPRWEQTGEEPPALKAKWEAYLKQLMVHEVGHRDMAVAAAAELSRTVWELPPAADCSDLELQLQALGRLRMTRLDEEAQEYDVATSHGVEQGASFP